MTENHHHHPYFRSGDHEGFRELEEDGWLFAVIYQYYLVVILQQNNETPEALQISAPCKLISIRTEKENSPGVSQNVSHSVIHLFWQLWFNLCLIFQGIPILEIINACYKLFRIPKTKISTHWNQQTCKMYVALRK